MHFNANGKGHGRFKRWFFNGQMAVNGIHQNGKKEGVWKYYHFNGKVASIEVFKNNSLIKEKYFNEKGITIDHDTTKCKPKVAYFEGGIKKFQHKINRLVRNQLDFKSNGKFHVDFIIDIKGNIRNVSFDENLPKKRETYLIKEFEKIKGWKPAIVKHRTVPFPFNMGFTISIK
ncbi:toxin-antitoxin system YwqK family antitoxin [Polaribacter sp.]|uniref:toxin-antitoxin system YwqK family antitoxin n=1 Tax=Polaribacter sp. TaxID=1920175 RepID=UPI003F6AAC0E